MCGGIVVLILSTFLLGPYVLVNTGNVAIGPDEVGVRFDLLTGNLGTPLPPGSYFINPVTEEVTIYSTETQQFHITIEDSLQARTTEGESVSITGTMTFRIDPEEANIIHMRWQHRYREDFIRPTLRGLAREAIAQVSLSEIQADPDLVTTLVRDELEARLDEEGFILDDLSLEVIVQP